MHRPRTPGHGGAERRCDILRYPFPVVNQPRPLGHRRRHAHLVDLLEGGHSLFRQLGGPSHENHWALRRVNSRQPGDGVGEPRPSGEQGHGGPPGDAGVTVGHVHRRPFVPGVDEFDSFVSRGVHQGQNRVADDGENLLDSFLLQAADEQVASVQGASGEFPPS